ERNQAAVQRQRVARQRKGGAVARQIAARGRIPDAEIFKVETDEAEIVAVQAEAELVIVVVKNRMAVEREGGFLGDIRLVMQILDAAEGAGVEPLLLLRAGRVTLRQQSAGAKLDPVVVSVGAAFVNLLRRRRVAGPRLRAQDDERRADH